MEKEIQKLPTTLPTPVEKTSSSKIFLISFVSVIIGFGIFGALTYLGYTGGFMTDGACNDMILNQTNQSFQHGYNTGAYQLANLTAETKRLPVYNRTNETIEYIGYYNLTKCIGGNK